MIWKNQHDSGPFAGFIYTLKKKCQLLVNDSTNELPISLPRTIVPDVESCLRLVTGYRGDNYNF